MRAIYLTFTGPIPFGGRPGLGLLGDGRIRRYDFSAVDVMIQAMNECQILSIWDPCHYGYPEAPDPFSGEFRKRFAGYYYPRLR